MECKVCGRHTDSESANFCEYCGTSYREAPKQEYRLPNENYGIINHENREVEEPISFGNWLGSMLLMFIPFVGFFVYLFMLLKWSFGGNVAQTKKNWARAQLIISLFFTIMIFYSLASVLHSPEFRQVYNTLYQ
ncbi:hypothetical protein [Anaeromicropila herbilytica]|uniref:Zinc-ribbon domain-containing protein n=1 Tax=Anaeromicropila herbilytica TaxID=2785025 RepID=A0A7R7EJ74_9FIRM|nr:hypothetical protein [Anaeromicropila herbilytica]BCN29714.1 hypothetical protein bsdtb5_10090 [Anaeromicropila herbilytica]